jgi:hypothetical protein
MRRQDGDVSAGHPVTSSDLLVAFLGFFVATVALMIGRQITPSRS